MIKTLLAGFGAYNVAAMIYCGSKKQVFVEKMEWKFFKDAEVVTERNSSIESLKNRVNRSSEYNDVELTANVRKFNVWQIFTGKHVIQSTISLSSAPTLENYWEEKLKGNLQREVALTQIECMDKCDDQSGFDKCVRRHDLSPAVNKTFVEASNDAASALNTLTCETKEHPCLELKRLLEKVAK